MSFLWSARISPARAPVKNAMARNVCNSPVAVRIRRTICESENGVLWREMVKFVA